MTIGLLNLEPKIHNTALMQISQYHKKRGDAVEWYSEIFKREYNKIYCSSLFDYTPKYSIPENTICGGTGFDLTTKLPKEIENSDLDYSIYPNCDYSIIWFSRGCIRNCPFCIVKQKEGYICSVKPKNLNPKGKYIAIQDNNFFANPKWKDAEKYLDQWQQPIDFNSGIDLRIFNKKQAVFIKKYKIKMIHCAWDNPKENMIPYLKNLLKYFSANKIMCYVLIGYWSNKEEDMMRIKEIARLRITPFAMPYNKKDEYQRHFSRYVNNIKKFYKRRTFEEYKQAYFYGYSYETDQLKIGFDNETQD